MAPIIEQAPELAIDRRMGERYGRKLSPRMKLERRVVWNLLAHLKREGYEPYCVAGGDEGEETVTSALAVMEQVFDLDEACVGFRMIGSEVEAGNVVLVFGNDGWDSVSDWRWSDTPRGNRFNAAMDKFDGEDYA